MNDLYHQSEFVELLLRHLFLSPTVFKKAQLLGLTGDDFLPAGSFHLPVHKIFADIAFEIGSPPIDLALVSILINTRMKTGEIPTHLLDTIISIMGTIFGPHWLSETYFLEQLPKFIRSRRAAKIMASTDGNLDRIHEEYQKVIFPLDTLNDSEVPVEDRFVNPFKQILKKPILSLIQTGFVGLNAALGGGLGFREFGLIIGHSGGGKTAMGVSFARGAALFGFKVLYCSMEEEKEDIANRLYSSVFEIDYTSLHNGSGYIELDQKAASGDNAEKLALLQDNLLILDLKGMTPMKPYALKRIIDDHADKTGFIYQLVIVDQLQFMEPETSTPGEQDWIKEGRIVRELDEVSHQSVGNTNNYFGMWALHQAKGKVKIYFSSDEIAGFKGIIHKPETVLGIGRENPSSDNFELFSLKNRHAKNFRLPMHGDLSRMNFIEKAEAAGALDTVRTSRPPEAPTASSGNFGAPEMAQLLGPPSPPVLSPT